MSKKNKPVKNFDCIEMKRKGSEYIYNKIKDMSIEEELAFWKKETKKFRALQQKYKSASLKKAS